MSDSLEDKLEAITAEIASLEKQTTELSTLHAELIRDGQRIPTEGSKTQKVLDELYRKLNNARQTQLCYLLTLIRESSNRIETVTKNLKETSDAQVEVAKTQVEVTKNLLGSSHRLEQFALFLIALTAIGTVIVGSTVPFDPTLKTIWLIASVGAILALAAYAYHWPRVRQALPTDEIG